MTPTLLGEHPLLLRDRSTLRIRTVHRSPMNYDDRQQFAEALGSLPDCRPIVPFLRGTTNIEQQLERLQQEVTEPPAYTARHRQLSAVRWYLQVALSGCDETWYVGTRGITNYLTLLDEIARWGNKGVLLVTFNYDRLLEHAVTDLTHQPFDTIDAYIAGEMFAVVKVHGSVNWGRVLKNPPIVTDSPWQAVNVCIKNSVSLEITTEYAISNERPLFRDRSSRSLFPAIAIPVQSKQQFECPESHLNYLRERLPEIRKVLIIGWRGMDNHFVALLREKLVFDAVDFAIVCNGAADSQALAQRLEGAGIRARFECFEHGFSRFVTERVGAKFFHTT